MSVTIDRVHTLRMLVFIMLMASAIGAFMLTPVLWNAASTGKLPGWAPFMAPTAFSAFVFMYAMDRGRLVARKNYPLTKACGQVFLAVSFLLLLWSQQRDQQRTAQASEFSIDLQMLLSHRQPMVRAAACELAGSRHAISHESAMRKLASNDPWRIVRDACQTAAEKIGATE